MHNTTKETEFLSLLSRHQGIIYKISAAYEKEAEGRKDLFQEIVIQLWKNYDRFKGKSSFSTWLYRVALNTAISSYRKQKRAVTEDGLHQYVYSSIASPFPTQENEQLAQLYNAIQSLPQIERAIILLYLEDKSYREMEEIVGIKEATLRVKMKRIKEKLTQTIKAEANEY